MKKVSDREKALERALQKVMAQILRGEPYMELLETVDEALSGTVRLSKKRMKEVMRDYDKHHPRA